MEGSIIDIAASESFSSKVFIVVSSVFEETSK
jgi:hypothetical protein